MCKKGKYQEYINLCHILINNKRLLTPLSGIDDCFVDILTICNRIVIFYKMIIGKQKKSF